MSPTMEQPCAEHCLHDYVIGGLLSTMLARWCCRCGAVLHSGEVVGQEGPERLAYLQANSMYHESTP
jgi:hypothetical protein